MARDEQRACIGELRARINRLDAEIVQRLNERAAVARDIGRVKREMESATFAPDREEVVYRRVAAHGSGPLPDEAVQAIYAEIISACRALEQAIRVAFLGPPGTFTQQAARKKFGSSARYVPVNGIDGVFTEVERGHADYGVVPIENSTEGGVHDTLEVFIRSNLRVCAEILLPVHHNLMAKGPRESIERIYSKAQVFGQCKGWLSNNFAGVELVDASSTTRAARAAAKEEGAAAIAHEEAARLYGLRVLFRRIEDSPDNLTRFFVIGNTLADPSGHDKTSVLCFIKDEIGALYRILVSFMEEGINLTYIQSLPSRRKAWDYCFYIDLEGHCKDPNVAAALEEVGRRSSEMKLLGSYPVSARQ